MSKTINITKESIIEQIAYSLMLQEALSYDDDGVAFMSESMYYIPDDGGEPLLKEEYETLLKEKRGIVEKDFEAVVVINFIGNENKNPIFDVFMSNIDHEDESVYLYDIMGSKKGNEEVIRGYRFQGDDVLLKDIRAFFDVSLDIILTNDNVKWHI